jgi:hypothetical protein
MLRTLAIGPKGRPVVPRAEKIKTDERKLGKRRHGTLPVDTKKKHTLLRKVP